MEAPAHELVGEGPTVVLLHSFPLDRGMWTRQLGALSAAGFRVVAPDLPGFGATPTPTGDAPSLDAYVASVVALLDAIDARRPLVLGLSLGGYVALRLAALHPDRVGALVLADTRAAADNPEVRASRVVNLSLVRSKGAGALIRKMLPMVLSGSAPESVQSAVTALGEKQSAEGVSYALLAMRDRHDGTDALPSIKAPTLCLVGDGDKVTPPDEMRAMADAIPGARYVELAGAGHLSNFDAPEGFDREVVRFANDHRADFT
ncbi:MAG: alpha/beta fold hydrolase [Polyangiales bacterium]